MTWIVLVPCEMLGVQARLGYLILDTRDSLASPELVPTMITLEIIGYFIDLYARMIFRRLAPSAT